MGKIILTVFLLLISMTTWAQSRLDYSSEEIVEALHAMTNLDDLDFMTFGYLAKDPITFQNYVTLYNLSDRQVGNLVKRKQAAGFLVRILSDYYDEGSKEWRTIQGLGTIVRLPVKGQMRSAVISVSHVTQGKNVRVYDRNEKLLSVSTKDRLADVDRDIEILLLDKNIESPLEYHLGLFISKTLDFSKKVIDPQYEPYDYDRVYVARKQHVPVFRALLPKNWMGQRYEYYQMNRNQSLHRAVKTTDPRQPLQILTYMWDNEGTLDRQTAGYGYISSSRMTPGLSGAPLIQDLPSSSALKSGVYNFRLTGLVQGHHLYEDKSFFVGEKEIQGLAQKFISGSRGATSATKWRARSGMTFRDYGQGVFEAAFTKTPSSSFLKGDSGNAISVDGYQNPHLNIGMTDKSGSMVVGKMMQTKMGEVPVLADPQLDQYMPSGMTAGKSFGPNQDLWVLANSKSKFKDKLSDMTATNTCLLNVTPKGIKVEIQTQALNYTWERSRAELAQGFRGNKMVERISSQYGVELSGLFVSDLTSTSDIDSAVAPSVTLFTGNRSLGIRLFCNSSAQTKATLTEKYNIDSTEKVNLLTEIFSRAIQKKLGENGNQ